MKWGQILKPDWDAGQSISNIPIEHFISRHIEAAILDVDGTLLPGRDVIIPIPVLLWLQKAGIYLKLHLLSNNPSRSRISAVADQLGITYTYHAAKPRRGALRNVIQQLDLPVDQIAMIGDRIFTDILCGNRLGLYTVLIRPVDIYGNPSSNYRIQKFEKWFSSLL